MGKTKVYIDGSAGTTGLRINERFAGREDDIRLMVIPACQPDRQLRSHASRKVEVPYDVIREPVA